MTYDVTIVSETDRKVGKMKATVPAASSIQALLCALRFLAGVDPKLQDMNNAQLRIKVVPKPETAGVKNLNQETAG